MGSNGLPEFAQNRYINSGNVKFAAITIEALPQSKQSNLKYQLYIDGKETWDMALVSPEPSHSKPSGSSFWSLFGGKD